MKLLLLYLVVVPTLSTININEEDYIRLEGGKVILSGHLAFIHQGSSRKIEQRVTIKQPISVIGLRDDISMLNDFAKKMTKRCDDLETSMLPDTGIRSITNEEEIHAESGAYVHMFKGHFFTANEVRRTCDASGYKMPEPYTEAKRKSLQQFLVEHNLFEALIASEYDLASQSHISPYSGLYLHQRYRGLYKEYLNQEDVCVPIDWTFKFKFLTTGEIEPWRAHGYVHKQSSEGFLSRNWYYHPGNKDYADFYSYSGVCTNYERTIQYHVAHHMVCEIPSGKINAQVRFQDTVKTKIQNDDLRNLKAIKEECRANAKYALRTAQLVHREFEILIHRLGISDDFLKPSPTYEENQRDRRFWNEAISLAGAMGVPGFSVIDTFLKEDRFQAIESHLDDNKEAVNSVKRLATANQKELDKLRSEIKYQINNVYATVQTVKVHANVTNAAVMVESFGSYVQQELTVFKDLLNQALNREVPDMMGLVPLEMDLEKVVAQSVKTGHNFRLEPDLALPVMIVDSNTLGHFNMIFNYVIITQRFDLFQIISLPRIVGPYMYLQRKLYEYVAIDMTASTFMGLTRTLMKNCQTGQCELKGTLQPIQESQCDVSPILGDISEIPCPTTGFPLENFFYPTSFGILYAVDKTLTAHTYCDHMPTVGPANITRLEGIGLIVISPGCRLRVHEPALIFDSAPREIFFNLPNPADARAISVVPMRISAKNQWHMLDNSSIEEVKHYQLYKKLKIETDSLWTVIGSISLILLLMILISFVILIIGCNCTLRGKKYIMNLKKNMESYTDSKLTPPQTSEASQQTDNDTPDTQEVIKRFKRIGRAYQFHPGDILPDGRNRRLVPGAGPRSLSDSSEVAQSTASSEYLHMASVDIHNPPLDNRSPSIITLSDGSPEEKLMIRPCTRASPCMLAICKQCSDPHL